LNSSPAPVPISRLTFDLPHSGHFLIAAAVIDWNFSNRWPHASHSYSYVGMAIKG
jgi:hypothetical protein